MRPSFSALIARPFSKLFGGPMTHEKPSLSENESTDAQSTPGKSDIRDRVQTLREKTSQLSETLDRVEKNLKEASGKE